MALRRDFAAWVARVGSGRAAKKLGVTERTLRRWLGSGIPPRKQGVARSKVEASAAYVKRRDRARERQEKTERLPPPHAPVADLKTGAGRLTREQALPTKPYSGARGFSNAMRVVGFRRIDLTRRRGGIWWYAVEASLDDFEDMLGDVIREAQARYSDMVARVGPENVRARFFITWTRWVPKNPSYARRGQTSLVERQQSWTPVKTRGSYNVRSEQAIATEVASFTDRMLGWTRGQRVVSILKWGIEVTERIGPRSGTGLRDPFEGEDDE